MSTHRELRKRARAMGHEITPELDAELRMLAGVPDEAIRHMARRLFVKRMAKEFAVPEGAMELRLEGIGLFQDETT